MIPTTQMIWEDHFLILLTTNNSSTKGHGNKLDEARTQHLFSNAFYPAIMHFILSLLLTKISRHCLDYSKKVNEDRVTSGLLALFLVFFFSNITNNAIWISDPANIWGNM